MHIRIDIFITVNCMSVKLNSEVTLIRSLNHWFNISSHGQRPRIRLRRSSLFIRSQILPGMKMSFCVFSSSLSMDELMTYVTLANEISTRCQYFSSNQLIHPYLLRIAWCPSVSSNYYFHAKKRISADIVLRLQLVVFGWRSMISLTLSSHIRFRKFTDLFYSKLDLKHLEEIVLRCAMCQRYRSVWVRNFTSRSIVLLRTDLVETIFVFCAIDPHCTGGLWSVLSSSLKVSVRSSVVSDRRDITQNSSFSLEEIITSKSPLIFRITRIRYCIFQTLRSSEIWYLSLMYCVSLCVIICSLLCFRAVRTLLGKILLKI